MKDYYIYGDPRTSGIHEPQTCDRIPGDSLQGLADATTAKDFAAFVNVNGAGKRKHSELGVDSIAPQAAN